MSFATKDVQKQLRQSKVLVVGVNLNASLRKLMNFSPRKFSKGISVDCSKYYTINENNDLLPKADYGEYRRKQMRLGDERDTSESVNNQGVMGDREDQGEEIFRVNRIAPYSEQNLVSTNLFNDEACDLFIKSLTHLEKMVITPVHMQVMITRLRTNNVAFSSHAVICYPLQSMLEARNEPYNSGAALRCVKDTM